MDKIFKFISEIGKLKSDGRRGWMLHEIKNPETTAAHSFQVAMLVLVLGMNKKDFDVERAIKMALIHDICEVYSPDLTSYDAAGIKEDEEFTKEDVKSLVPKKGRPTTEQRRKMKKVKEELERDAIERLTADLPAKIGGEIKEIWEEYEKRITAESKFVKQADHMINLLQGMNYWKEGCTEIKHNLWIRRAKEAMDDPELIEFLIELEKSLTRL